MSSLQLLQPCAAGSLQHSRIQEAFPVVDLIPLISEDEDILITGLSENLVYDIPTFISGSPVPANGSAFEVQCQSIAGGSQAGPFNTANSAFPIHVHDKLMDINVTPRTSPTSRTAEWPNAFVI